MVVLFSTGRNLPCPAAGAPATAAQLPHPCVSGAQEADLPPTCNSPKTLNKGKITGKTAYSEYSDPWTVPQLKSLSSIWTPDEPDRVSDRGSP